MLYRLSHPLSGVRPFSDWCQLVVRRRTPAPTPARAIDGRAILARSQQEHTRCISQHLAMSVTIRTRKVLTNRLLNRKQMVSRDADSSRRRGAGGRTDTDARRPECAQR